MKFQRLHDLRTDHDLTQNTLAEYLCIKQGTYSDYESGKINVPIEAFIKLADYYNTSIDYLVGQTNVKEPYPSKPLKL